MLPTEYTETFQVYRHDGDCYGFVQPATVLRYAQQIAGEHAIGLGLDDALYQNYCARLKALGALDFDDLLTEALRLDTAGRKQFRYLLVDEFQDVGDTQYAQFTTFCTSTRSDAKVIDCPIF